MGSDIGEQCFECPCLKSCKECNDFKKLIHLEDGLVIYQHNSFHKSNKEAELVKSDQKATSDVFILHNISDVDKTSTDFVPELEKHNVSCPRCRNIIERTKMLLKKSPKIDKKAVIRVCGHCLKEGKFQSSCYECEKNVKKFITEYERKEERMKVWESKIKNLLQDEKSDSVKSTKLKSNVRSGTFQRKPSQGNKPEKKFLPETSKLETTRASSQCIIIEGNIKSSKLVKSKENLKNQPVASIAEEAIRSDKKSSYVYDEDHFLRNKKIDVTKIAIEDMPTDTFKELRKHFESKSLHDLKGTNTDLHSLFDNDYVGSKSNRDYTEKLDILMKIKEPKTNLEFSDLRKHKGIALTENKIYFKEDPSVQEIERLISRETFKDISEFYSEKNQQEFPESKTLDDIKAVPKEEKNSQSILQTKKYHSKESLITLGSESNKESLEKDFIFCFPKDKIVKKEPIIVKSSAELILDTQKMLLVRSEEQKRKNEEKYQQRLYEQEIKKIAREEKKRLLEDEKKRISEEEKKRLKEEKIKEEEQQKHDEELKNKERLKSVAQDKIKPDKNKKVKEDKSKVFNNKKKHKDGDDSEKSKLEPKNNKDTEALKADKETKNIRKEKERKDREEQLRLQKEEKEREKKEKEKLKRDKEAERQKEIEEKHKQKKEELKGGKKEEQQKRKDDNRNKSVVNEKTKSDNENNVVKDQSKGKDDAATEQLKKALIDLAKEKEEALKMKKQQEENERKTKEAAAKKEKETDEHKLTSKIETKSSKRPEPEKENPTSQKQTESPTTKELNINQIKVRRPSADDLILKLVQLKQSETKSVRHKPTRLSELNISPLYIKEHQGHKTAKLSTCLMCIDSELELDVESIVLKKDRTEGLADIVIGQKIFKYKPPLTEKKQERLVVPIFFQRTLNEEYSLIKEPQMLDFFKDETEKTPLATVLPSKSGKIIEQEPPKGVVRYALSDRTFIDKGWTMLPTEKVVRKMNVYRMRPAHPEFDWFEHNKNKRLMLYNTGEKLAEFDDNGLGRWFYRNGRIALDYYNAEEINAQQRIVVYSSGEPDERGRTQPLSILATFDYLGNGIVFDHGGKIRLKYNQTEGVLLDRSIGPVSHWKWHTLNDPPVLQKVMIDTQMAHKDPEILKMGNQGDNKNRPDNEEMLAIEFDNFIKEKSKKLTQTFKPFQIKMKALKINEHFSLKILDQATVYLIFRDGTINLKLNIGMILDHKEIVDTDTAEVGEVSNNLERFPARTDSLAGLQRSVAYAQRFEKLRTDRERRLYPTEPCVSADRLTAPASRPLRLPFRTVSSGSISGTHHCKCTRKLSSTDFYYNTRFI